MTTGTRRKRASAPGRGKLAMHAPRAAGQEATALQSPVTIAIGEKTIGADADETGRQDVKKEAAKKLVRRESDGARACPVSVVLVGKGDALGVGV